MTSNVENDQTIPKWAYEKIKIVSPNPFWEKQAIEWKDEVRKLLMPLGIEQVEHIGSTSIPGLPAKPIIDLMARVPNLEMTNELITNLEKHDWHYVPPELDMRNWRRFFVKVKENRRVAHLHIMQSNEKRWEEHLVFRDTLKENRDLLNEYAILKSTLAMQFKDDREQYTTAKSHFIENVLRNS
ncbi:GrpB family protein [Paenisporosarcina cavernae]|uniref:GrpB family protein n=1 Tax=Paenisporosarcina cavernae TaxID=2320858 RepID=A0A385YSP0_9BACL|nr:GrpB family protein [Paenisporosarcina cavernae]AYC28662.1 GrpB family protein [Paenisporosarcina cavernae]